MWTDPFGAVLTTGLTARPNSLALTLPSASFGMHEGVYQCNVTSDQAAEFQRSDTATGNLTLQGELSGPPIPPNSLLSTERTAQLVAYFDTEVQSAKADK